MSEKILEVRNLSKSFKDKVVLNSLSFSIERGEIVGFLGSNGAGKSTTLRCILGIYAFDKGEVEFGIENKIKSDAIGYLPEERGLYKNVKVMDMLLYFSRLKNYPDFKAKKRILEYLKKFDLEGKEKVKIEELSKGMAQKVQFIASVLHEPELLILDEPLSGLDPVSQDLFKNEIRELSRKGTAIFFSSHQIDLVEELCHRVYLLNQGRFVLSGNISDIKKSYGGYSCFAKGGKIPESVKKQADHIEKISEEEYKIYLKSNVVPTEIMESFSGIQFDELSIKRISLHEIYIIEVQKSKGGKK